MNAGRQFHCKIYQRLIPSLDGGYVMFLLYEMISRREPNEKVFETALKIGMAILLALMAFVF